MEDEAGELPASLDHFIVIRSNAQKTPLMHAKKNRLQHAQETPLPSWFPVSPPARMECQAANKRMREEAGPDSFDRLPDEMLRIIISFLPNKSSVPTTVLSKR